MILLPPHTFAASSTEIVRMMGMSVAALATGGMFCNFLSTGANTVESQAFKPRKFARVNKTTGMWNRSVSNGFSCSWR